MLPVRRPANDGTGPDGNGWPRDDAAWFRRLPRAQTRVDRPLRLVVLRKFAVGGLRGVMAR